MIKQKLKAIVQFIVNPKLLFCFGIAWMITNGWSYILFGIGSYFKIGWMVAVSGAYLAVLWFPFSFEKIVTLAIAVLLLRWLFPKDQKTLGVLRSFHKNAMNKLKNRKKKKEEAEEESLSQEENGDQGKT